MDDFNSLNKEIVDGMDGKNSGIPMGFNRLNHHVSIRKGVYYLLGGNTGTGKTALLDDAFVLNPIDYLLKNKNSGIDLEIIYNSMERRKNFKLAKWISRRIFLDTGKIIPINRIMGWVQKEYRLTGEEKMLIDQYEEYIDFLMTKIHIISGPQNPTGIRKYVDDFAKKNGEIDDSDKYNPTYKPHKDNLIVEVITDHIGLTKGEKDYPKGKSAIDKSSQDKQRMRDLYEFSPIDVSQFNRAISNPMRIKNGDVMPNLEDFKETSETQENADVVLALFDPMRYKVADPNGYDLEKLRDQFGYKKYKSLHILKNSYGGEDISIGLAFQGAIGLFKEMPKRDVITESDYNSIIDNSFFLNEYK